MYWKRLRRAGAPVLAAFLLSGCVSYKYHPRAQRIPSDELPEVLNRTAVHVVNDQADVKQRRFGTFDYDLKIVTDCAVRVLNNSLASMDIEMSTDAPRQILLRVDSVKTESLSLLNVRATVQLHVTAGEAYVKDFTGIEERADSSVGQQTGGTSGGRVEVVDVAIANAVRKILEDLAFIEFLKQ
jgi:hypothetical protein